MQEIPHVPVLYREVFETFSNIDSGVVIDCTMGYGGHSSIILEANPNIKLVGIDQDINAIEFCEERLSKYGSRVDIRKGRFSSIIKEVIKEYGIENIKGILADIGVSSLQLDKKERGFSFQSQNLDMRMDVDAPLSALNVVNEYSQIELEKILLEYGELHNYKQIASQIVKNRPFISAKDLVEKLLIVLPKSKNIHPATLLLQAIRIEVNNELGELESLLESIKESQFKNTKIAIISFHSLEDRIVKNSFASWSKSCICPQEAMRCVCSNNHSLGKILTKKPIIAKDDELKQNPRSRSAKMRVFEMVCK